MLLLIIAAVVLYVISTYNGLVTSGSGCTAWLRSMSAEASV